MYQDTLYQREADRKAVELGAVLAGESIHVTQTLWKRLTYKFAVYYFNKEGTEVGHWIKDLQSFCVFDTPRVWSDEFKKELKFYNPKEFLT